MFNWFQTPAPVSDPALQIAKGVIQGLAQELQAAAEALDRAAERFRNLPGHGYAASQMKQAASRAKQAAQGKT